MQGGYSSWKTWKILEYADILRENLNIWVFFHYKLDNDQKIGFQFSR